MTKYRVYVDRISVRSTIFIVESENPEWAENHADLLASNFDFNTCTEGGVDYAYTVEELEGE